MHSIKLKNSKFLIHLIKMHLTFFDLIGTIILYYIRFSLSLYQ